MFWTEENITEQMKTCKNLSELSKNYVGAYAAARRLNILHKFYKRKNTKKRGYWNEQTIRKVHNEGMTRSFFIKNYSGAYYAAKRIGVLESLNFKECGNRKLRCIYAIEFDDNYAYIGLTYNLDKRIYKHFNDLSKLSTPRNHQLETNSKYKVIKLTNYIESKKASYMEGEFVEIYRNNKWIILNIAKTGGLGGSNEKWNKKLVLQTIKKHKNYKELMNSKDRGAYYHAATNKYTQELIYSEEPFRYTKKDTLKIALKYKTTTELLKSENKGYYNYASKNGFIKELKYKQ